MLLNCALTFSRNGSIDSQDLYLSYVQLFSVLFSGHFYKTAAAFS